MNPYYYKILLHPQTDEDFILESVQDRGAYECYISENETQNKELFGYFTLDKITLQKLFADEFIDIEELPPPKIDWEAQWKLYAPLAENGICTVKLSDYNGVNREFKLLPGGGFGDLSHPTTQMMLKLFPEDFQRREVVDIGSGSGVLSIAAAKLNAFPVYGVDLCKEALQHSEINAQFNEVECKFLLPEDYQKLNRNPSWIFLNMITSEQSVAFNLIDTMQTPHATLITSGVLKEQEDSYLNFCRLKGWKAHRIIESDGWLGFVLYRHFD